MKKLQLSVGKLQLLLLLLLLLMMMMTWLIGV